MNDDRITLHQVRLEKREWQQIVNVLATVNLPWIVVHPLLTKIAGQVELNMPQQQQQNLPLKGDGHGIPVEPD